ncbi:Family c-likeg-protein-coupled receptor protein [Coniochaeta hoffmannii]|uniref:Family c-likeg-protein-coupled receptor protein n=1 Tax=Coniochaeta hoffmannii TaxID=91930 RepID=A0AA38RTN4_9PEZI|nr:Family c-likeg-protein-coupled receptor protein [Coniochaeta hoffmannii]
MGGRPDRELDIPICAVFLVLFVSMAATHMTVFQFNRRRDHKFLFSMLLFGFCMARIAALSTRIAWAANPTSLNIGIAAGIFTQAGVLLLFVVNLLFSQRILRAYHPNIGWHPAVKWTYVALLGIVIAMFIMVISASIALFFTLSPTERDKDRTIQLFAGTFLAVIAFLPIPVVLAALAIPRKTRVEKFGQGRFRTKIRLLLSTALLLSAGAGFRLGAGFAAPPASSPAWFDSKACFYVFNFGLEFLVVFAYAVTRFDRRFHVPNGSFAPGHYAGGQMQKLTFSDCINREDDLFGSVAQVAQTTVMEATPEAAEAARQWTEKARRELYGVSSVDSQSEEYFSAEEG